MSKMWLLRLHRWITLVLSIPLAVLIVTGLILSVEPILTGSGARPGVVTAERLDAVLAKHDPEAKARTLMVRAYAGTVSIGGAQRGDGLVHVDLASNERIESPGALAGLLFASRRLHEHLIAGFGWLVPVSTIAMLGLILIGILMGWPRLANSLSGWHKGTGWFVLPLLILSPLTGLLMTFGITFAAPPPRPAAGTAPIAMTEAIHIVGASYDLARVSWIRPRGGVTLARLDDGGEMRVFAVTRDGLLPTARNWPRLIHEGNWSAIVPAPLNVITSVAMLLLISTGLWMWARRKLRRRPARTSPAPARA
ncbi:MAG: PepSY domain-containing protein [Rhodopseudomonas sp.]|uniref:PepSY-associated TM helix domain-containing protein n=1 Tax=Rhodopseudomonas sp. TaxID=1078 RepID=UPI001834EF18|nr:PepSY-associated TM helix domain-containing protein [Rhodopseudomonas sp.]NVN86698.1 PepSY domain-containing protein [Rhodopseudomonas sp.]